jgi:hypothetical protein
LVLGAGIGLVAACGLCLSDYWDFATVCGFDFCRVIVTSTEVLVFLFFMITDPRSVPSGRVGRVVFGSLVGLVSVLLMAPQTDEFGTKVGLLAGLVIVSLVRPLLDRLVPEPKSAGDDLRKYLIRVVAGAAPAAGAGRRAAGLVLTTGTALVLAVVIVLAGIPARGFVLADASELLNGPPINIDPSTLPPITVAQEVIDFDHELAGAGIQAVAVTLAQNLELENQALFRRDGSILTSVDHGDRLIEMQARLSQVEATGTTVIQHYRFDAIDVSLLVPFGAQSGLSLGMAGRGTVTVETYVGAGVLQTRTESPFAMTFAVRRATGSRWLNVAVTQ